MTLELDDLTWDGDGLVPAVVQDVETLQVLMVAWMDRVALETTLRTGRVHFWSRSRQELWEKGATSGNTLALVGLTADCDGDALLVSVRPAGPACHTGSATCFEAEARPGFASLDRLWATIEDRLDRPRPDSYTAGLVEGGPEATGRKVVEEATEVLLAAKDHAAGVATDERLAEEAADLIFHLLVTLGERRLDPAGVFAVLEGRRR